MAAPFSLNWTLLDIASTKKDGSSLFSPEPLTSVLDHFNTGAKTRDKYHIDRQHRILVSCNVMLIEYYGRIILVDTGPPSADDSSVSNEQDFEAYSLSKLARTLRDHGVSPSHVTDVVLTSRDKDHAGGTIYSDRAGNYKVRFSKAKHYCHRGPSPRLRPQGTPQADFAFNLMEESGMLHYIEEETEIVPGIKIVPAFGPSAYSSMVQMDVGADRVIFTGDVVPTSYHITPKITSSFDDHPEITFQEKQACVDKSLNHGYLLAFSHSVAPKTCWVEEGRSGYRLRTHND